MFEGARPRHLLRQQMKAYLIVFDKDALALDLDWNGEED